MILFDKFKEVVFKYPDKDVFIDQKGKYMDYKTLYNNVLELADYLKQNGVKKGDYVTVLITMSPELYTTLLALWFIGAIPVFFDVSASNEYISKCSEIIKPHFIIGTTFTLLYSKKISVFNDIKKINIKYKIDKNTSYSEDFASNLENMPALITFTSGSTGIPKTIVRTHQFLLDQYDIIVDALHYKPLQVDLGFLPVFTLANIGSGVTTVIPNSSLKNMGKINAKNISKQIEKYKVNTMTVSPTVLAQILQYSEKHHLELLSLKELHIGGGPVFPSHLEMLNILPCKSMIVYGSSEAEPISAIDWDKDFVYKERILNGCGLPVGKPFDSVKVKILQNDALHPEETGINILETNEIGEIIVTGKNVLKGYYNGVGDAENKLQYENEIWHKTGDCGYIDENGELWLVGRKKEFTKNGLNLVYTLPMQAIFSEKYNIKQSAYLKIENKNTLFIEKKDELKIKSIDKNVLKDLNIEQIVILKSLPMDKRHSAKIDYPKLRNKIKNVKQIIEI